MATAAASAVAVAYPRMERARELAKELEQKKE
jgi:hypothetical protein